MTAAERIAKVLGGAYRSGTWSRSRCPVHHSRGSTLALRDGDRGLVVHCHAGCDRDDILAELRRRGLVELHRECVAKISENSQREPNPRVAQLYDDAGRIAMARRVWDAARHSCGSPLVRYLANRGITTPPPPSLRWTPRCWHRDTRSYLPAMIGLVEHIERGMVGVHRTYLTPDLRRRDRATLGPIGSGAVRLAAAGELLMISEGLETGLSAQQACGLPCWAAMSTSGLMALLLPPIVRTVVILADHDENGAGERAARLAADRWLAEDRRVRIAMPPNPGTDFNDVMLGRAYPRVTEMHEEMGSKTKFWYRRPGRRSIWLFKYPHPDTGEHWAEKVAAEVARLLGIPHAVTKLAICGDERGSISKSFVRVREQLFHGNQEMAGALDWYDPARRFRQSHHTLANIYLTLDKNFLEPEGRSAAKSRIADYVVLDALIGNTDRHHENWGILLRRGRGVALGEMAPSFDHASSLGRELRDVGEGRTRQRLLKEQRIGSYSERARGAVFWSAADRHAPSPLELVRRAAREFPDDFRGALQRLQEVQPAELYTCIARVPVTWISRFAREFAFELMCYNLSELRKLLR